MRFAALHLQRFGPFEGAVLQFGPATAGLQIVYGPNERGKSTALRAITALLFGFPTRTEDSFGRDYATLRVGARIEVDGQTVSLMRRKGMQRTLFEFDPQTGQEWADRPIDPVRLSRWLGGVDSDRFGALHALDAPRLRSGGQSLVDAGSELGAVLFGAAAGLPRLQEVMASIKAEADALYLPSGRVPPLNGLIADCKRQLEVQRAAGVRPAEWLDREAQRDRARAHLQSIEGQLREARQRLARLERQLDWAPQLHRLTWLRHQLATLADAPVLDPLTREHHAATVRALQAARQLAAEGERRLAQLRDRLAAIQADPPQLDAASTLMALESRVQAIEPLREALPVRRHQAQATASVLWQALIAVDLAKERSTADESSALAHAAAQAQERLPGPVVLARARQAVGEQRALEASEAAARRALERAAGATALAAQALQGMPQVGDLEPLRAAIATAMAQGEIENRLDTLRARLAAVDTAVQQQAKSLGLADPASASGLAPIAPPVLTEALAQARQRSEALSRMRDRATDVRQQMLGLQAELARWRTGSPFIDRVQLDAARRDRDAALDALLQETCAAPVTERRAMARVAVQAADHVADRRFEDASRVAEVESLERRILIHQDELLRIESDSARLQREDIELRARWRATLSDRGWPPLEPEQIAEWSGRRERLLDALQERQTLQQECVGLEATLARLIDCLMLGARASGVALVGLPSLAALLRQAVEALAAADAQSQRRRQAIDALSRAEREQAAMQAECDALIAERAQQSDRWRDITRSLRMHPDASAIEVESRLEVWTSLSAALSDWVKADQDVRQVDAGLQALTQDVGELAARLGETAPTPAGIPDWVARQLRLLEAAREKREHRLQLDAECQGLQTSLAQTLLQRDEAEAQLAELCRQAGVDTPDALAVVIERSLARDEAHAEAVRIEASLRERSGADPQSLLDELSTTPIEALQAFKQSALADVERLDRLRDEALSTLTRAQSAVDAIDGDASAAQAAQQLKERLAATSRVATDVARLRLARALLERTLSDHLRRAQGPLLAGASRWLAQITGDRWIGLAPDWSEDRQILAVIRSDGLRLELSQLSEGTADALFLALRLAVLEARLPSLPPLPLVLDDVLGSFDDDRAARTLSGLATLGKRNQVVYFTHHTHLVELAARSLPEGSWSVCELTQQSAVMGPHGS